jgi:signal transduction histidine kinase
VREVVERMRETILESKSEVKLELQEGVVGVLPRLPVDHVVANLLSNALKYGAGKEIRVQLTSDGATASLRVADQGIGIDPSDHVRIFERFERAASEKHYSGFGIGLWIVRQVVEAIGGSVSLASELGHGASFTVTFPLRRPA